MDPVISDIPSLILSCEHPDRVGQHILRACAAEVAFLLTLLSQRASRRHTGLILGNLQGFRQSTQRIPNQNRILIDLFIFRLPLQKSCEELILQKSCERLEDNRFLHAGVVMQKKNRYS